MTGTLLRLAMLLVSSIASFYFVIGGPNRSGTDIVRFDLKHAGYWFGVDAGREDIIFLIGSIGFILLLIPSFLGLFVLLKGVSQRQPIIIFCIFGLLSLFIPSLFMTDNLGYFVVSAKVLAFTGSAIALSTLDTSNLFSNISKSAMTIFISLALVFAQATREIYDLNWREIATLRGGPVPILVLILLLYYLISFVYVSIFTGHPDVTIGNSRIRAKFATFAIFILIGSLSSPIVAQFRSFPSQVTNDNRYSLLIGSVDVLAASEWLNVNSDDESIVATNRFCIDAATPVCPVPK